MFARRMGPGDMILFHANYVQIPFDYYFHRQGGAAPERGVPVDWPGAGMKRDSIRMTAEDVPRLRALMSTPLRLWLVYHPYWTTDPRQLVPSTLATWAQLADHRIFTGSIQVYLYRLASPAGGQKPLSQIRE